MVLMRFAEAAPDKVAPVSRSIAISFTMIRMTNEIVATDRDEKTGRFLPGNSGFGGRPKGARSKFSEAFIIDLHATWEKLGVAALEKCAQDDPGQFLRVCASLMPRDLNLNVGVDPTDIAMKVRAAIEALGNELPAELPRSRPPLRRMKVINP
jgi:hypothetical protein